MSGRGRWPPWSCQPCWKSVKKNHFCICLVLLVFFYSHSRSGTMVSFSAAVGSSVQCAWFRVLFSGWVVWSLPPVLVAVSCSAVTSGSVLLLVILFHHRIPVWFLVAFQIRAGLLNRLWLVLISCSSLWARRRWVLFPNRASAKSRFMFCQGRWSERLICSAHFFLPRDSSWFCSQEMILFAPI
jgi:hypothetical protein